MIVKVARCDNCGKTENVGKDVPEFNGKLPDGWSFFLMPKKPDNPLVPSMMNRMGGIVSTPEDMRHACSLKCYVDLRKEYAPKESKVEP